MVNTSKIIPHFLQSNVLHSGMCDVKHSTIIKPVLLRKLCWFKYQWFSACVPRDCAKCGRRIWV